MVFRPPDPPKRVPYDDPGASVLVGVFVAVMLCLAVGGFFLLGVIEGLAIVFIGSIVGSAFYLPWKLRQFDPNRSED